MKFKILFSAIITSLSFFGSAQQSTFCLGGDTTICDGDQLTIDVCNAITNNPNVTFLTNFTEVGLSDDQFSGAVNMGFSFTFYGQPYTQVVLSSNGYLTFGPGNANSYSPWAINAAAPSAAIPTNAVMGPWQDYNPGVAGTVGYSTLGTAPNRRFVAVWKNVTMFGTQQLGCSAIVLHETSNKVEIFLDEKPLVAWNGGAAIQATQNINGTIAHVVPGRNWPTQWTANLDGQEWIPNGPNNYIQNPIPFEAYVVGGTNGTISWQDTQGGTYTSSASSITVTPNPIFPSDSIGYFINFSSCAVGQQLLTSDTTWVHVNSPSVSVTGVDDNCSQSAGQATATPSGGISPYTYQWNDQNNQTTQTATGLPFGTYGVTVTDSLGCTAFQNVFINDSPISLNTTYTQVSCPGGSDGTASVTVTPTPGSADYNWYDAGGQITQTATGLSAGTYHVEVTTNVGCIDTAQVVVDEVPEMIITLDNSTDATCNSGNDGTATVSVIQGTAPYSYSWTTSTSTSNTATDLPAGTHTVTVTDANGCIVTLDITIGEPPALQVASIAQDTVVCIGDTAWLYAQGAGGSSPYIYTWTANGNVVGTGSNITVVPPPGTTEYCLVLTEQCGSPQATACMNVRNPENIMPMVSPDITGACFPVEVNFENITSTSEIIDFTVWEYSDGTIDTINGLDPTNHEFGLGLYDVSMEVVTESGCSFYQTFVDFIEGYPYPEADFYVTPNPASVFEPEVSAFDQSGSIVDSYEWIADAAEPTSSNLKNPTFTYPQEVGIHDLILVVENIYGCRDTTMREVRIQNDVILYAPNTFTPDNDNLNNEWRVHISGVDIFNFNLTIFNRWGELIWESNDPDASWDGTYGGKLVETGTYVWTIRAEDAENDNNYEFNGFVNVIK